MGVCSARAFQEEMGLIDGRQREGLLLGERFISYFQIESALLEYPGISEAGAIVDCLCEHDPSAGQVLKIYLTLNESLAERENAKLELQEKIIEFIRNRFAIMGIITVRVKDKLPMTRSGKILRSVLKDWN